LPHPSLSDSELQQGSRALTLGSFFFAWIVAAICSSSRRCGKSIFLCSFRKKFDSDGFLEKVIGQRHPLVTTLEPAEAFAFDECVAAYQGLERSFWSHAGDNPSEERFCCGFG
jgi:hypothetical protein